MGTFQAESPSACSESAPETARHPRVQDEPAGATRILGTSAALNELRSRIDQIAASDATVLLRGENGTGKELSARAIHLGSRRSRGPFVTCELAAMPEGLIEDELFGHERGAFTGATRRRSGCVASAHGGTLFLDEIGDLSMAMQVKLLRLIQEKEFKPLGETRAVRADVRFVAATHRNLEAMVDDGSFREDLYYRLNVVDIWLPPLRQRREDIPILVRTHAARVAARSDRATPVVDDSAVDLLAQEEWPGNVRELLHRVERLVILAKGDVITAADVRRERPSVRPRAARTSSACDGGATDPNALALPRHLMPVIPLADALRRAEREAIEKAVSFTHGNKALAARLLDIGRTSLYAKLRSHGLSDSLPTRSAPEISSAVQPAEALRDSACRFPSRSTP